MAVLLKYRAAIMESAGRVVGKPRGWERLVRRVVPFQACHRLSARWIVREGIKFFSKPSVPIGYNLRFFGTYEPELRKLMRAHLKPGFIAMDVGANVGWHSMLMSRLVGDSGQVFAFEANPSVRSRLAEHVAANHLANVVIIGCALSDREGRLSFVAPAWDSVGAGDGHISGETDVDSSEIISVEAKTLDAVASELNLSRLDLIKIDVEGFEWPVLVGGQESIGRHRPLILFEFNTIYASRGEGTCERFRAFFAAMDYEVGAITRRGVQWLDKKPWPDCANLIAMPCEMVVDAV